MPDWLRLELSVPSESSDRLVAELWEMGTVGLEECPRGARCLIRAFFSTETTLPADCVLPDGSRWRQLQASLDSVETIPERDWMEAHRRGAQPFPVGRSFLVDPREPCLDSEPDGGTRHLLRLPARRAFGVGSHESTRLLVEWLEDLDLEGRTVLDVGAGTGILSFVALANGAAAVTSVEVDPVATFLARANQGLNGSFFDLVAGTIGALAARGRFDLALVNVLPENVVGDLERLSHLVRHGGRALFSGILTARGERFAGEVEAAGFSIVESRVSGDWQAWLAVQEES